MILGRGKDELSVMEAVNQLSNMVEIDVKNLAQYEGFTPGAEVNWRNPVQALENLSLIKETFRIIHRYLQNMVRKDQNSLKDSQTMRGIQAIMLLAADAVEKLDKYTALYPKQYKPVAKLKEYTDLQKYYRQQILKQVHIPEEEYEAWEGKIEDSFKGIEAERRGIQDLEAVRKDQNYELFFIKGEDGKPYFSRSLIRHIRLVGNFDELVSKVEGEDPLLAVRELYDREMREGAEQILKESALYIDRFYQEGMKHKNRPFIGTINKSLMALRMAANSVNLIENQSFKSCLEYFADFQKFLRAAMETSGYKKLITGEQETDEFKTALLNMIHALCCYYFMRIEPRKETLKLIHHIQDRGNKLLGPRPKEQAKNQKLQIWNDLEETDQAIRYLLNHYPNGPLLRTLDAFREEEEFNGWDPLAFYNFPSNQFTFASNKMHVTVLRMPCPIRQEYIQKAEVVPEFEGFLRFYRQELKPDRHLFINLQNRTSWEEFGRCKAIEDLAKSAEHYETFYILGLPKNSPFFLQEDEYQSMGGSDVFIETFMNQLESGTEGGFYLPESLPHSSLKSFFKEVFALVHEEFFESKTKLTRIERLNFIEIFYAYYVLKVIELLKVDSISFSCKDALDTGIFQTGVFFGFLHMLNAEGKWSKEDSDFLLWLFYSPALLVRDRPINQTRLQRGIMALRAMSEKFLTNHKSILDRTNSLFKTLSFPLEIKR